jgi:hypothetical protein
LLGNFFNQNKSIHLNRLLKTDSVENCLNDENEFRSSLANCKINEMISACEKKNDSSNDRFIAETSEESTSTTTTIEPTSTIKTTSTDTTRNQITQTIVKENKPSSSRPTQEMILLENLNFKVRTLAFILGAGSFLTMGTVLGVILFLFK